MTEFEQTVCELKSAGSKIEDNELVLQLLSSMPESYQTVKAIDIMFRQNQNAIDMDFVKNKLLLEETRQSKSKPDVSGSRRGTSGNFRGDYNSNAQFPTQFPFNCHLCNNAGHKRSQCPKNSNILEEIYIKVEVEATGEVRIISRGCSLSTTKNSLL